MELRQDFKPEIFHNQVLKMVAIPSIEQIWCKVDIYLCVSIGMSVIVMYKEFSYLWNNYAIIDQLLDACMSFILFYFILFSANDSTQSWVRAGLLMRQSSELTFVCLSLFTSFFIKYR